VTNPIDTEILEAEWRVVRDRCAFAQTLVSAEEAVRNALVSPAALAADAAAGFMLGRAGRGDTRGRASSSAARLGALIVAGASAFLRFRYGDPSKWVARPLRREHPVARGPT
jgi:hypothetical protein